MEQYEKEKDFVLENVRDFNIEEILECGQCFHFQKLNEMEYEILALGKYLHIRQDDEQVIFYNTSKSDYETVWKMYFDMDRDYSVIKESIIQADERLQEIVTAKQGIRILRQDFFETLISFIISQNKQIPHIKQIVHTISERYGEELQLSDGRSVYAFPSADRLLLVSEEELRACKTGFRAPYIMDAVAKVCSGEIDFDELSAMTAQEAKEKLMSIKGVGEKVANCVLLFGLGFRGAFPVDVWMKRIMETMYFDGEADKEAIEKLAYEKFGDYAGYAQQYLFAYGREHALGK